jgi:hypothetical protein
MASSADTKVAEERRAKAVAAAKVVRVVERRRIIFCFFLQVVVWGRQGGVSRDAVEDACKKERRAKGVGRRTRQEEVHTIVTKKEAKVYNA